MSVGKNSSTMADESAKREFLAAKLSEEGQLYENKVNLEAAIALGPQGLEEACRHRHRELPGVERRHR
jgi:hypothetical protein